MAQPVISPPVPLTGVPVAAPVVSRSEEGLAVRVVPLAHGLSHPTGVVFLPDGQTILVVERPGRLRVVKDGVLDPTPVAGVPTVHNLSLGGMHDIVLHPDFATNHLLYLSYSKPGPNDTTTLAVARARFEPSGLTEMKDILVADAWGSPLGTYGGRMIFGPDKMLYVAVGDRDGNTRDDNSPARKQAQNLGSHIGKILRLRDDGSIPPDNPFAKDPKAKGEVYTYGHRNAYGLAFDPQTGEFWASEFGAAGGDELNRLIPAHNYGWPVVSLGRNYTGTLVSEQPWFRKGMDMPIFHWNPVINPSNMLFYTGKKFPTLTNSLIVAGAGTKRIVTLTIKGDFVRQVDSMLRELNVRFRDIRQGPDECLYVLTEGRSRGNQDTDGMLLRIEPAPSGAQQVNKEQVDGIRNLSRIESTVACAGAITPKAVQAIKDLGYGAIINLRLASEPGADIEGHIAAAKAAGIRYIHIPFSATAPDPAAVDTFLSAITSPGVEPAFIH